MFCDGLVTASMPSLSGRPPQAPVIMSTSTKGAVLARLAAHRQHGVAALAGGGHAVGQGLGEGAEHHVEHAVAGERARRAGAGQPRVQDGPLRRDHVDAAEDARVVRHVLAQHRADRQIGARLRERQRGVQRGLHLGRRAGPVAGEVPVVVDGDGHRERHRVVAEPVAVEVVGEPVGALAATARSRRASPAPRSRASSAGRRASPRGRSARTACRARARPPCTPRTRRRCRPARGRGRARSSR